MVSFDESVSSIWSSVSAGFRGKINTSCLAGRGRTRQLVDLYCSCSKGRADFSGRAQEMTMYSEGSVEGLALEGGLEFDVRSPPVGP